MSGSGSLQSIRDVVASIRKVILSDPQSHDDVMYLENPENLDVISYKREGPSVSGSVCATQSVGRVRHSKNFCSVGREVQQRQISCSMELTESSSLASFAESSTAPVGADESALLSRENIEAATKEIKKLVDAAMATESPAAAPSPPVEDSSKGLSVEELALSVLRPKLSEWLNENLPGLVREIVEREIGKLIKQQ
ncbi:MAG: DUF2497 domain-containing protein [Anaplasma ovis]|uniref:DUF2497 domain-containing protein n=1 Tax=Anaplasma ovis str. Haibei TaxID=1248439 RepID=A0A2Z2L9I7_9RICK|nr:DUF2497 domain-containing protein [Anaplasma ovis]ASI48259.1 hypothetical protein AOV_03790 [Anaplasma ovis str. Haibei]